MAQIDNGRRILFAADQSGTITAEDVDSGETYWTATKTGEAFVAGVSGAIRRYASAAFQTAYHTDVLFLGSTTGKLLAIDASTGVTIWTVNVGNAIRALVKYDSTKNWIYVPTDSAGIIAFNLAGSSDLGIPPALASGWVNPGGSYSLGCSGTSQLFCTDRSGLVRILDRSTGSVVASGASLLTSPSSITGITGGVVVSNASKVVKLAISGSSLTVSGTWTPGSTLSPALVFQSVGSIYAGGSDGKLHKVSLTSMVETASVSVASQGTTTVYLGPPNYDVTNDLFLFGSSNGHLWAVKYF
jgi:outer membrane protein assembly factor BamB